MSIKAHDLVCLYNSGLTRKKIQIKTDLELKKGESSALLGPSGAGKTTFALMLAGLLKPGKGKITYKGKNIFKLSQREKKDFHKNIQLVSQNPHGAFDPRWKISKSLDEPFVIHALKNSREKIKMLFKEMELDYELVNRLPSQLSGGELQRLAILRSLCLSPELLLLDEPTSMLDTFTQALILNLLKRLKQEMGFGLFIITHDPILAENMASDIFILKNGKLAKADNV